jgi:2-hydroxy-6-oxonona-2,4-dienedioate hydrolase
MEKFDEHVLAVGERTTRLLRAGDKTAPAALFLHGAVPGVAPFCSGAHIWGDSLAPFLAERQVIALDCPGSGGTALGSAPLTVDVIGRHAADTMAALGIDAYDVVGHDVGGIVGIWLALEGRARSISIVASASSAPMGDNLDNILLLSPPQPAFSGYSQAWAFERLSYSHMHIDDVLLSACEAAANGEAHRASVAAAKSNAASLAASVGKTKYRLWEACRGEGLKVPTQVVWGSHDPTTSRESGYVLFRTIAKRQTASQFHVVNRAGSFVFREQPEAFHHMVSAFQLGVMEELGAAAA